MVRKQAICVVPFFVIPLFFSYSLFSFFFLRACTLFELQLFLLILKKKHCLQPPFRCIRSLFSTSCRICPCITLILFFLGACVVLPCIATL
ncbi:hypothetical protein DFH27DRAFT_329342 [Peziza echinospora]|nr:hypothetical protein DFH27DRAFT_329342 [Peziza echinospora]